MKLASLSSAELRRRLHGGGLNLSIGSFDVALRSPLPHVARGVELLYADYPLSPADSLIDFHIELSSPTWTRRWLRPQVAFSFDGQMPFKPLPIDQAFAMFEWGLNWVVANHSHQFAVVHAAAVEKNGRGFILPGAPGSGKSTLCAAMVCRGWRLFSDEMALISLGDGLLWPIPRPISLKNASIGIIKSFGKDVVLGETVADTAKGSVAHMRAPQSSIEASGVPVQPFAVVFPRYSAGASTELSPISKGRALMRTAENCFNYPVLGPTGFTCLGDSIEHCYCYTLSYSNLDEAIAALEN